MALTRLGITPNLTDKSLTVHPSLNKENILNFAYRHNLGLPFTNLFLDKAALFLKLLIFQSFIDYIYLSI